MTLEALVSVLQCPACGGGLDYETIEQADASAGACGLLRCACAVYPVLDGIPILRQGRLAHHTISDARIVADGNEVEAIVESIEMGQGLEALVRLLAAPLCPWPLNRLGVARRLSGREPLRSAGLALRQRRIRQMLAVRDHLTAEDWMSVLYWHAPVAEDPFNFFFRLGQPRHLAALALTSVLLAPDVRILDLACGYGHLLHTFTAQGMAAVGVDQNVHQVWVARHYVAPEAAFVCADAEAPLPFLDGAFGATLTSDAFHYFSGKARVLAELRRCSPGPTLLAAVGNALVPPSDDGVERTPEGYAELFSGLSWRVFTEADLLARYLSHQKPDLTASSLDDNVLQSKWLSYIVAEDERLFRDHGVYERWPHLEGQNALNPLYEVDSQGATLQFPSPWYAQENRGLSDYLPATISRADLDEGGYSDLAHVGLPARYARPQGRPLTCVANRTLSRFLSR